MKHKEIIFYLIAVFGVVIVNSVYYYNPYYYPQYNNSTYYPRYNGSVYNYTNNYGFRNPIQNNPGYVNYFNHHSKRLPNRTISYGWNYYSNRPQFRFKRFSNGFHQYPPAVYQYGPPAASNNSHHLITGIVHYGDHLSYNKSVNDEPFTWWGKVTKYVTYPPKGIRNIRNITVIQIYDLIPNGTGGWATIVNGGVGHRNVTIKLKSQKGKRMSFQVEIYTN